MAIIAAAAVLAPTTPVVADAPPVAPRASVASAVESPRAWTLGGRRCDLIMPLASPVGIGGCQGVRPGSTVVSRRGGCTMNFLFKGSDGRRYIGTAGHCVLGREGRERSWRKGPVAKDVSGKVIGRFAYAVFDDPKDFALIRLRRRVKASPQMCHFGGPTGINSDRTPAITRLQHYGKGMLVRSAVPARSAWAWGMPARDHVFAQGAAAPGDSGSGVTSADGRAVGVLVTGGVHIGRFSGGGVDAGVIGITRLRPQLWRAKKVLDIGLRLRLADPL